MAENKIGITFKIEHANRSKPINSPQKLYALFKPTSFECLPTSLGSRINFKKNRKKFFDQKSKFYTSQADGEMTLTLPLIPILKSGHFLTLPCPPGHDLDSLDISLVERTLFQMFRSVSSLM